MASEARCVLRWTAKVKGAARRVGRGAALHAWVAGDRCRRWARRRNRAVPTPGVGVLHDYGSLPGGALGPLRPVLEIAKKPRRRSSLPPRSAPTHTHHSTP